MGFVSTSLFFFGDAWKAERIALFSLALAAQSRPTRGWSYSCALETQTLKSLGVLSQQRVLQQVTLKQQPRLKTFNPCPFLMLVAWQTSNISVLVLTASLMAISCMASSMVAFGRHAVQGSVFSPCQGFL